MNKIKIITTNIVISVLLFFTLEYIIYSIETNRLIKENKEDLISPFEYNIFHQKKIDQNLKMDDDEVFRKPEGLSNDTKPITIFGCSVAYGQFLKENESFGYLLSDETKRPVYNRAIIGDGLQQMLYQTLQEDFYKVVPPSKDIIYIFIPDHYRRMTGLPFQLTNRNVYFHYTYKKGKFIPYNYDNYISNFLNTSYTITALKNIYYKKVLLSRKHINNLSNLALQYFIQTRTELQKHTKSAFNFYIIFYQRYNGDEYFRKILEQNGFKVITIDDLTSENLSKPPYLAKDNMHPSEKVWKLITPKIAKIVQ